MATVLFDFQISTPDPGGKQWWWPGPHGGGNASIEYKSAAEVKDVKADGKNNGRHTFLGYKNAEIDVTLTWKVDFDENGGPGPIDSYANSMLADISTRNANAGKAMGWIQRRQRIHNVDDVTVELVTTKETPGTMSVTATLKLFSWVKPVPEPAVTATPDAAGPWSPTQGPQVAKFTKRTLPGFAKTPPKVTP